MPSSDARANARLVVLSDQPTWAILVCRSPVLIVTAVQGSNVIKALLYLGCLTFEKVDPSRPDSASCGVAFSAPFASPATSCTR